MVNYADFKKLVLALVLVFSLTFAQAASIKSKSTGGAWTATGTWTGGVVPTSADDVEIDGAVTISSNVSCKSVKINASKSLTFGSGGYTLSINNSNWGTCFENNGTFTAADGTVAFIGGGSNGLTIKNTTTTFYNVTITGVSQMTFGTSNTVTNRVALTGGAIVTSPTYGSNAVLELKGSVNLQNNNNTWYSGSGSYVAPNIEISGTVTCDNGSPKTIKKTLTINSGGTFSFANSCLTLASTFTGIYNNGTCTLGGIIVPSGATWNVNNNYTLSTLQIQNGGTVNVGSYTLTLNMNNNSQCGGGNNILTLNSGGTFNAGTGTVILTPVDYNDVVASVSGGIVFNNVVVNGPNTLDIPNTNSMTVNGSMVVNSGGKVNNPDEINFGPNAVIQNNGTTNNGSFPTSVATGVSGTGGGTLSQSRVAVISPNTYTLSSNLILSGSPRVLIIQEGATFVAGSYTVTVDSVYLNGTFTTTNTNGLSGAFGSAVVVLGSNSTVTYSATSGTQNITKRTDYTHLTLSGASTKSFTTGTYNIKGNFSVSGGAPSYNSGTRMVFNGSAEQSITCSTFDYVEFGNSGNKSLGTTTTVTNTLTMSGSAVLLSNGRLVLASTASGTARVASIPNSASITGSVTVQRYIPSITRRSRLLSTSVAGFSLSDLKDNIFVTGSGGASNGFDASSNNQTTVYTYQESPSAGRGWKAATNINNTISAGKGMLVFVRGDRSLPSPQWYTPPFVSQNAVTLDFIGTLNQGDISPELTYNNTGNALDDGWNMVGNPLPSQISWDSVDKTDLSPFYYTLDASTGSYIANTSSTPIASGQGFFVQAIGPSPTITFRELSKVSSTPTNYFKTSNSAAPFEVRMIKDSINADVAWLKINKNGLKTFNLNEDAAKMSNSVINLAFVTSDGKSAQYNTAPLSSQADTFLLYAYAANGTYTMQFNQVKHFPEDKNVYFVDLFTNNVYDLTQTSSITFTINSNSSSKGNRFQVIVLTPSQLPVTWLHFGGKLSGNNANLTWTTASEINNAGFTIERNTAGKWESVGMIAAKGNNNTLTTYSFTDGELPADISTIHYRIKQTDRNGSFSYSNVISLRPVNTTENNSIGVYPNPATDLIQVFTRGEEDVEITLINSFGKTVLTQRGMSRQVNLSELDAGVYFVEIKDLQTQETQTTKLIKE